MRIYVRNKESASKYVGYNYFEREFLFNYVVWFRITILFVILFFESKSKS